MKAKAARTNARVKGEEAALKRWLDIFDRERAAEIVACLLNPERRPSRELIAFMERHRAYLAVTTAQRQTRACKWLAPNISHIGAAE